MVRAFISNCPIREKTADGTVIGRCWYFLKDSKTCPRHGNVETSVKRFKETGNLTDEDQQV